MDKMKQKKLLKELYEANLRQDRKRQRELYQREIAHILEKRREGKSRFCGKWLVTDES
jgi:hypothetical protein